MKRIICILFVLLHCCLNVSAQSADKAQKQYMQKDYVGAIATYEKLLTDTAVMQGNIRAKANVYYNLANCYYRTNNYALAVLNYQRALRIDPSDKDAAFNLQLTQTKLQDQFTPPSIGYCYLYMDIVQVAKACNDKENRHGYILPLVSFFSIEFCICLCREQLYVCPKTSCCYINVQCLR